MLLDLRACTCNGKREKLWEESLVWVIISFRSNAQSLINCFVLDPANPGFGDLEDDNERLDASDADFVDIVHTCSGVLGFQKNLGHVDFFPNGGISTQPGCGFLVDFVGACSHARAFRFFAESIRSKLGFMASTCNSWADYKSNKCGGRRRSIPMGEITPTSASGTYYLETLAGPTFSNTPNATA